MPGQDISADKARLRTALLKARDSLPPDERAAKSRVLQERVLALPQFSRASCVCLYLSVRSEAGTDLLLRAALAEGKRILVPVVDRAAARLRLSELHEPQRELAPGAYGVPEPLPRYRRYRSASLVEFMILPCVGFDEQGYRLGYGRGYYDRLLASLEPGFPRVLLAFEIQGVQRLPVEAHDVPVDMVVTEERVRRIRGETTEPS